MASKARLGSQTLAARPSSSGALSTTSIKGKKVGKVEAVKVSKKKRQCGVLAFSTTLKAHEQINFAELRKRTARRQVPAGENKGELAKIIKSLKNQKITVEEFVSLVTAFTADQGECFRSVMAEELDSFRKLSRKIYETMTSDVNDVLVNEHVQITSFYEERRQLMHEKMMRMINEVHEMCPQFDFGRYMAGRQDYLNTIMPIPREVNKSDEEVEMHRRQQAYHRLQWLRMEGERLGEENRRLKNKLNDLKAEQKAEIERSERVKEESESKKQQLEEIEAVAQVTLEKLNESVEKSLIENEAIIREQEEVQINAIKSIKKTGAIKKIPAAKKKKKRPAWVSEMAQEMEKQAAQDAIQIEISEANNRRLARGRREQTSPFHYSPPRDQDQCPSGVCGPPAGPYQFPPPPEMITTPQMQETNIHQMTTTVQQQRTQQQQMQGMQMQHQQRSQQQQMQGMQMQQQQMHQQQVQQQRMQVQQQQQQQQQRRGRACAPRDTWGGYY